MSGQLGQALFFCSPDPLEDDAEPPGELVVSFDRPEVSEPFEASEPFASEPVEPSEPVEDPPSVSDPLESFAPSDASPADPLDRAELA